MDVYVLTFGVLAVCGGFLAYTQHKNDSAARSKEADAEAQTASYDVHASAFKKLFLPVYLLVMASDWLQGPYIYTLYKDEKALEESVVAALFTTGFVSAAISAMFIGSLADQYGRRRFCLVFCATYSVSCLTVLSNDLILLFFGRLLGGVSTTLMYSVFEGWMVTEYHARGLDRSSMSLSSMFGTMTTLNGLVAILSGVLGEFVVNITGTKTSPFLTSIVCLLMAGSLITTGWTENRGDSGNKDSSSRSTIEKSGYEIVRQDKRILVLGLISTCFEGTMYLFVFFWSAGLKASHAIHNGSAPLPFGLIFATFMSSMMIGSLFFSHTTCASSPLARMLPTSAMDLLSPSNLLTTTIAVASTALLLPTLIHSEMFTFWCFCAFEACIGVYFPSMGNMKGRIVDDGVRAKVYGVLRVPLNVFVVGMLSLTKEGDKHRERVFLFCGALLLVASIAAGKFLEEDPPSQESSRLSADERSD